MTVQPEILYRNILKIAQEGRGDGTVYASATSATVDQDNKTFTLSGLSIIDDLGADANDKFNGYVLTFTDTDRTYLITDWVSGGVATVFGYPNAGDTGPCEIRRTLYTDDFNPSNPLRYACNGDLSKKWIDRAANNTAVIQACMPNGIDDGGFELNSLSDYWTTSIDGDGAISINASSPILGSYDCVINMGTTATNGDIKQTGKVDLKTGKTYGIIFKARHSGTGTEEEELNVQLDYAVFGASQYIPVTFSKINSEDALNDLGNGTNNQWRPDISDTNAWEEATFTVPEDIDAGDWVLRFRWHEVDNHYDLYIDEIYLFEVIQPDTLIIAGHNMAGGFAASSYIALARCSIDRTSMSSGYLSGGADWQQNIIDLDADVSVDGNSPIYETFTGPSFLCPIFVILFAAISGKTWEASEIWLGERWTWDRFLSGDWEPDDQEIEVRNVVTLGGLERSSERYRKKIRSGNILYLDNDEHANWRAFVKEVGLDKPFWYYLSALSDYGLEEEILLMKNDSKPRALMNADRIVSVQYKFKEVL